MKLRLTPRATKEIAEIGDYLRSGNPFAAGTVRAAILDSLQSLALFPRAGRAQSVQGVRKLVTRKYRYSRTTTVDAAAEEVVILTVQHPARNREQEDE
jgi:toxin ParE1/3/4